MFHVYGSISKQREAATYANTHKIVLPARKDDSFYEMEPIPAWNTPKSMLLFYYFILSVSYNILKIF